MQTNIKPTDRLNEKHHALEDDPCPIYARKELEHHRHKYPKIAAGIPTSIVLGLLVSF